MVKLLEWDTQHFGYPIGCIIATNDTPEGSIAAMLTTESALFRLIYLFLPEPKRLSVRICEKWNIVLADQKVIFHKKLTSSSYTKSTHEQIASVMDGSHQKLIDLAIASGEYSRFRLDNHFSLEEFEGLYEIWIKKSLNGQIADNCYAYYDQQHPIGVVTIKKENDHASIGIIAVDSSWRGKGIGQKLLYAVEKYAYENGVQEITVATQKRNRGACHFYEQNGYLPKTTTNIYHFWNNDYYPIQ